MKGRWKGRQTGEGAGGRRQRRFLWLKEAKWSLPCRGDGRIQGAANATLSINGFV